MQNSFLDSVCCIAQKAGDAIMKHYQRDIEVARKADHSPVTSADLAANTIIVEALAELTPDIPIISEEQPQHCLPEGARRFWLVDPLDGTKSYIRREGEFTVNIALIDNGVPVLGVILIPALNQLYAADSASGAWRQIGNGPREAITTRSVPESGMVAMVSLSHRDAKTDNFLKDYSISARKQAASSLKFCRIAEGEADLYPRFGPTMEWDSAAGHAIVLAAGGRVTQPDGSAFTYGAPDFRNGPFVVWGR